MSSNTIYTSPECPLKSGSRMCVLSLCLSLTILLSSDGRLEKTLFGREILPSKLPSLIGLLKMLLLSEGGPETFQWEIISEQHLKIGIKVGRQAA